ncbi:MAG: c-type cytochrome [Acidobacteria bacterium]|nr:c-type cytochrome [Acidobacteriota bacterium]
MRPAAAIACLVALSLFGFACTKYPPPAEGFLAADGLEVSLWAAEPDVVNPTNMAIDERGRIWVTEAVNYRRKLKEQDDLVADGDQIVILEDTDRDGRADSRKVFDQRPELRAPLGIAVLGDKVYVSQSPDLIVYTKDEQDNIVDRKVLLTGFGGFDHDHGLHVVTFGADGRLYFNMGDRTFDVTGPDGAHVVSSSQGPYMAGAVLRMNQDGTGLEIYADNFRNPYELAMDSFGTIWQTDNDDDGNQWTRLNYVMVGGDFGYWGPTGVGWRTDHGTHFHHELPGVVPDIARTGAGSPTGLLVYEGNLLPERYRGNLIHSEPGKRHIYSFFLSPDGAGYRMKDEATVSADDPNWRPSDVAAAPDGAVYTTDWYDPVVGGHNMKDSEKGRIYRIAPPRYSAPKPKLDLESKDGLLAALRSPNESTRYRAWMELKLRGEEALPWLESLWAGSDAVGQARALWLLAAIGGAERPEIDAALAHSDPRFRILGLRVARLAGRDVVETVNSLLDDADAGVLRECALALRTVQDPAAVDALVKLAKRYDGEDRWYLEAWAIGAQGGGKRDAVVAALQTAFPGEAFDPKLADLLWELHAADLPKMTRAVADPNLPSEQRLKALRAIGDRAEPAATKDLADLVGSTTPEVSEEAFHLLSRQLFSLWIDRRDNAAVVGAVRRALGSQRLQAAALDLTEDLGDPRYAKELTAIARDEKADADNRALALQALGQTQSAAAVPLLEQMAASGETGLRVAAIRGLQAARRNNLDETLGKLLLAENPPEVRNEALRALARHDAGLGRILDLAEAGDLPAEVRTTATNLAHRSRSPEILARAERVLPAPKDKADNTLPANPYAIANRVGDIEKGRAVFTSTTGPKCSNCHSLDPKKELAGPTLATIGSKYDKRGLLDAILNPSAGIAPEYYVYILDTTSQGLVVGVISEETPDRVVVRNEFGDEVRLDPQEIVDRRKSNLSMMPEDIVNTMTEQELIDLLEFLSSLHAPGEEASQD